MSDKFRALRFCIISLYYADQNNDYNEDVDDDNDMMMRKNSSI
jgi:hypothetical protein